MKNYTLIFLILLISGGCRRDTSISFNMKGNQKLKKITFFNKTKRLKDYTALQSLFNIIIGKNTNGNIYVSYDVDAVNRNNFQSIPSYSQPPFFGGAGGFIDDTVLNNKYSLSIGNLSFDQFNFTQNSHNYKLSSSNNTLDLLKLYNATNSFHLDSNGITLGIGSITVPDTIVMDTIPGTMNCKFVHNSLPVSWNIDNNNKLGVIVAIYAYNASGSITNIVYDVVPDSDGKYDFSAMVNSCPGYNKYMLEIYRGNFTTITSSAGKSYTVIVYTTCRESVFL